MERVRGNSGATLVELMVALAIGALLLNFAFNISLSTWRSYKRSLAAVKINDEARSAVGSLAGDIESSMSLRGGKATGIKAESGELKDDAGRPAQADSLTLIVPLGESYFMRNGRAPIESGSRRVSYSLDGNGAAGQSSLVKTTYLMRAGKWVEDGSVALAENVRSLDFRYYDGSKWLTSWDASSPPKAVEVNLVIRDESKGLAPRKLSTVVGIVAGVK